MKKNQFQNLLKKLADQNGEEKLRISFHLSQFVRSLREQGRLYDKKQSNSKLRTTS